MKTSCLLTLFTVLLGLCGSAFADKAAKSDSRWMIGAMLHTPKKSGIVVAKATPGSPAAKAGLQAGDKILEVNQLALRDIDKIQDLIAIAEGQEMVFKVERKGKKMDMKIRPARLMSEKVLPAKVAPKKVAPEAEKKCCGKKDCDKGGCAKKECAKSKCAAEGKKECCGKCEKSKCAAGDKKDCDKGACAKKECAGGGSLDGEILEELREMNKRLGAILERME